MQAKNLWNRYLTVRQADPLQAQQARTQLLLILLLGIVDLLRLLYTLTLAYRADWLILELVTLALLALLAYFTRRGQTWPGYLLLAFVALLVPYTFREHLNTPLVLAYAVPLIIAPLVAAPWVSFLVAGVEAAALYLVGLLLAYPPLDPLAYLLLLTLGAVGWLSSAGFQNTLAVAREHLAELTRAHTALETDRAAVGERAALLDRQTVILRATSHIAPEAAAAADLETLYSRIVNLVSRRLDFYHAALYLRDEIGTALVLRAASSEIGQQLLADGCRVALDDPTPVGEAARRGEPCLAAPAEPGTPGFDPQRYPHSQIGAALPLRVRGAVTGVLELHTRETLRLSPGELRALQALADQLALSLDAAHQSLQAQQNLAEARKTYAALGGQAWAEILRTTTVHGYRSTPQGVYPLTAPAAPPPAEGLQIPIRAGGQTIAVIETARPPEAGSWANEELRLLETLAEQLGTALESARLYQESQRRATREQLTRQVSERLQQATDMEQLLQTTVEELNRVLGASHTYIRMGTGSAPAEPLPHQQQEHTR